MTLDICWEAKINIIRYMHRWETMNIIRCRKDFILIHIIHNHCQQLPDTKSLLIIIIQALCRHPLDTRSFSKIIINKILVNIYHKDFYQQLSEFLFVNGYQIKDLYQQLLCKKSLSTSVKYKIFVTIIT